MAGELDFQSGEALLGCPDLLEPGGALERQSPSSPSEVKHGNTIKEPSESASAQGKAEQEGETAASAVEYVKGKVHTKMASLETIRSELAKYRAVETRVRKRKFVDPKLLSRFVVNKGGPRNVIFGKLTAHYRALYDLLDKSEDLPQQIAKDEAKLVGANKPLPKIINKIEENRNDLTSVTAKIQKMDDEHEGLLTETRAQLRAHMEAAVKKAEAKEAKARNELSKEEEKLEKKPNISKKRLEEKRVAHAESVKELEKVKTYLEESETVELFEEIIQQDWEIIYDGGSKEERFELHAAKGGVNTDRPHGYRHGGNVKFTKNDFDYAAKTADIGVKEDKREATLQGAQLTLEAIRRHEGNADSINTWDRAVLTFGPGLAAFGVLESVFERVAIADPAFFQAEIASLGIGIKNKAFVVKDAENGTIHEKEKAKNYIANSPVLLGALRRVCGKHEVRRQMIVRTFETSIKRALNWSFKVKGPKELTGVEGQQEVTVTWEALTEGVDKKLVGAAQTVIASFIHASGNSQKLQDILAQEVRRLCELQQESVISLLGNEENRIPLVQLLVAQVRDNTWAKAINDTMKEDIAPSR